MTFHRRIMLPITAVAFLVTACSSASSPTPSTDAIPTPSAEAPEESAAPPESVAASAAEPSVDTSVDPWRANATMYRGRDGEQFEYECPAGGEPDTVWGTDVYTDDSSVCTAAVHVGLITLEEGGSVTIEIRPGEDSYESTERNGIETSPYPAWGGSFVIVDD